jgi:hypothetical protein
VVAAFGAPRTVVLDHAASSSSVKLSLANNSAVAILRDVTTQGWLYGIDNVAGREGCGEDAGARHDHETITVFVSGRCTAIRTVDAPSTLAAAPHPPPRGTTRPLVPPPQRRVSFGSEGGVVSDLPSSKDSHGGGRYGGARSDCDDSYGDSRHDRRQKYPHQHRRSDHPNYDADSWYDSNRHGIGEDDVYPLGHYDRRYGDRAVSSPRSHEPARSSSVSCGNGSSRIRHAGAGDGDGGSRHCGSNDPHHHSRSRSRSRSPNARPVSRYPPGMR